MTVEQTYIVLGTVVLERKKLLIFLALLALMVFPEFAFAAIDGWDLPWGSSQPPPPPDSDPGAVAAKSAGIIKQILEHFKNKSEYWIGQIKPFAEQLLGLFVTLEVCWLGFRVVLSRENIGEALKQFVFMLLMAGFFLAVIRNYDTWSGNIINGLVGPGGISSTLGAPATAIEAPFEVGMSLVSDMWQKLSVWKPAEAIAIVFVGLVVLFCFTLITARMILIKCEAFVAMAAALLLVGFGGSSFTKDYAINTLRYILSIGMKLFTMQLVMTIGIELISGFNISDASLVQLTAIVGVSVILLALVASLPGIVSGIMSGAHVGSGAGLGAAARGVGGAGMALGGAVLGAGAALVAGAASGPAGLAAGGAKALAKLATGGGRAVGSLMRGADGNIGGGSQKQQGSSIMEERLRQEKYSGGLARPQPPKPKA